MQAPTVTARWEDLVMLNFEIDPISLEPLVPVGTRLDAFRGRHLVSLVGFRFLDTAAFGIPVPFHSLFEEVNLRFYVYREVAGERRRGVVFVREIVPRAAVTWVANTFFGERYLTLPMAHAVPPPESDGLVEFRFDHQGRASRISAVRRGEPHELEPGSESEFIAEHYFGYTARPDGGTLEYRVDHPPWRVWDADRPVADLNVAALYGEAFVDALSASPVSAFIAEGSEVGIHRPRPFGSVTSL